MSFRVPEFRVGATCIGIDPGCSGGVAVLDPSGALMATMRMPTMKTGKNSRVNGAALADFLRHHAWSSPIVLLESVHAMPGQGVTSMFNFGHAAGVAEGVIQGVGLAYVLVTPQAWKKRAGLIGQSKDAARSRAIQLWPNCREFDAIGKGQALADAALIAMYGLADGRA